MHINIFGPFFIFFCFPKKQGRSDPCSRKLNWSGLIYMEKVWRITIQNYLRLYLDQVSSKEYSLYHKKTINIYLIITTQHIIVFITTNNCCCSLVCMLKSAGYPRFSRQPEHTESTINRFGAHSYFKRFW